MAVFVFNLKKSGIGHIYAGLKPKPDADTNNVRSKHVKLRMGEATHLQFTSFQLQRQ